MKILNNFSYTLIRAREPFVWLSPGFAGALIGKGARIVGRVFFVRNAIDKVEQLKDGVSVQDLVEQMTADKVVGTITSPFFEAANQPFVPHVKDQHMRKDEVQ